MKTQLLDQLVIDLIAEHQGGERFFEHLDEAIAGSDSILQALFELWQEDYAIILSGKFGRIFSNFLQSQPDMNDIPKVVVNGNLRHGDAIEDISFMHIKGIEFIFFDDSFYKGRTRDAIKEALEKNGASLAQTIVVYDGSKVQDKDVISLYRFFE